MMHSNIIATSYRTGILTVLLPEFTNLLIWKPQSVSMCTSITICGYIKLKAAVGKTGQTPEICDCRKFNLGLHSI
jgi:hypothetical protein